MSIYQHFVYYKMSANQHFVYVKMSMYQHFVVFSAADPGLAVSLEAHVAQVGTVPEGAV